MIIEYKSPCFSNNSITLLLKARGFLYIKVTGIVRKNRPLSDILENLVFFRSGNSSSFCESWDSFSSWQVQAFPEAQNSLHALTPSTSSMALL